MTMPNERYRAVKYTREFLRDLLDPKKTPKIPKYIRERAYSCLRHYPWDLYMEQAREAAPDIWGVSPPKTTDLEES